MVLQIGQQVGSYRIDAEIASGNYSYVYRASHIVLKNRVVALKLLHTTFERGDEQHELFFQEAQILEQLRHPHILAIIDVNMHEGYPYIVKEYAPGGSLRDRYRKYAHGLLPFDEALSILKQIGSALQFAHEHRIVHCDLKPENILFNAEGDALIADFDIARVLTTVRSQTRGIGGTPTYMAPEQFQGKVRRESDQYALACMAYELFTGKRPFSGADFETLRREHLYQNPPPLQQSQPRLPLHIEQVVLKAMAKKHSERYPDIATFIWELDNEHISDAIAQAVQEKHGETRLILKDKSQQHTSDDDIYYEPTLAMADDVVSVPKTPRKRTPVKRAAKPTTKKPAVRTRKKEAEVVEKKPVTTAKPRVKAAAEKKPAETTKKKTIGNTKKKEATVEKKPVVRKTPVRRKTSENEEKKSIAPTKKRTTVKREK